MRQLIGRANNNKYGLIEAANRLRRVNDQLVGPNPPPPANPGKAMDSKSPMILELQEELDAADSILSDLHAELSRLEGILGVNQPNPDMPSTLAAAVKGSY